MLNLKVLFVQWQGAAAAAAAAAGKPFLYK